MQYVNGGISFPTLKIPYQNNRYFCEILILSLENRQEDATTNPLHPQIRPIPDSFFGSIECTLNLERKTYTQVSCFIIFQQ